MKVLADITIVPMGVGVSLSKYVAECERLFKSAGIKHELHASGTDVEGEWDEIFVVLKECHETLHQMGAPRVMTNIQLGTRVDRNQTMEDKIKSVKEKI